VIFKHSSELSRGTGFHTWSFEQVQTLCHEFLDCFMKKYQFYLNVLIAQKLDIGEKRNGKQYYGF
jgi:hypothetical protein